jgi:hypothetical protein
VAISWPKPQSPTGPRGRRRRPASAPGAPSGARGRLRAAPATRPPPTARRRLRMSSGGRAAARAARRRSRATLDADTSSSSRPPRSWHCRRPPRSSPSSPTSWTASPPALQKRCWGSSSVGPGADLALLILNEEHLAEIGGAEQPPLRRRAAAQAAARPALPAGPDPYFEAGALEAADRRRLLPPTIGNYGAPNPVPICPRLV